MSGVVHGYAGALSIMLAQDAAKGGFLRKPSFTLMDCIKLGTYTMQAGAVLSVKYQSLFDDFALVFLGEPNEEGEFRTAVNESAPKILDLLTRAYPGRRSRRRLPKGSWSTATRWRPT